MLRNGLFPQLKSVLLHHWTIIFAMVAGGIFGGFYPQLATTTSFLGDIYLDLLQVAIIPIMMVALICSFSNIFRSNESSYYLKKLFLWVFVLVALTLITCFTINTLIHPGSRLSEEALRTLSNSITASEKTGSGAAPQYSGMISYIENIIPTNIIKSIYERNDIAVVIFSVILGISLGVSRNPQLSNTIIFFDSIFGAFLKYVDGLMYALPFGLFFLISTFISKVGLSTLISLYDLVLSIYGCVFVIFIVLSIIMTKKSKIPFFSCIHYLKNPYLIAFGTSSSFAAMPAAMLALRDDFKLSKQNIELVLPLGISLFKPGVIIRTIATTFFLMSLYHVPFNANSMMILTLTTILCSVASTAGPAILSATMYGMVLSPLGIPPATGILLLLSIEPLIDPVCTILNIQSNCTLTVLVGK